MHLSGIFVLYLQTSWSHSPRRPRRGSAAARLQGLRVRIPPGAWMSVSGECCVLSCRHLCVGLITRPESHRVWYVEVSVIAKPRQWEGPGPLGTIAPGGGYVQTLGSTENDTSNEMISTNNEVCLVPCLLLGRREKYFARISDTGTGYVPNINHQFDTIYIV
jgi:hypothetical protein